MSSAKNVRRVSAAIGASAVVAMCALAAVTGAPQASGQPVISEHYGGPVNTTIVAPSTMAGLPMGSSVSPTSTPGTASQEQAS